MREENKERLKENIVRFILIIIGLVCLFGFIINQFEIHGPWDVAD